MRQRETRLCSFENITTLSVLLPTSGSLTNPLRLLVVELSQTGIGEESGVVYEIGSLHALVLPILFSSGLSLNTEVADTHHLGQQGFTLFTHKNPRALLVVDFRIRSFTARKTKPTFSCCFVHFRPPIYYPKEQYIPVKREHQPSRAGV